MIDVCTIEGLVAAAKKQEDAIERLSHANAVQLAGLSLMDKVRLDVEKEVARRLLTEAEGRYRNAVESAANSIVMRAR